ncbi:MAG: hypothetical protein ISQ82_02590 [Rhodobacteraceae bacterium]|nr:hypothetical protein [Paracoccaceae bacterium]
MYIGIAYELWDGLGIIFITEMGLIVFGTKSDTAAVLGLMMITLRKMLIHLFSYTSQH